jgi:hypothetical protein
VLVGHPNDVNGRFTKVDAQPSQKVLIFHRAHLATVSMGAIPGVHQNVSPVRQIHQGRETLTDVIEVHGHPLSSGAGPTPPRWRGVAGCCAGATHVHPRADRGPRARDNGSGHEGRKLTAHPSPLHLLRDSGNGRVPRRRSRCILPHEIRPKTRPAAPPLRALPRAVTWSSRRQSWAPCPRRRRPVRGPGRGTPRGSREDRRTALHPVALPWSR